MATATITGKGQITIPVDVRQALHVEAASRLVTELKVVDRSDHVVRSVRADARGTADFADGLIERTASSVGCEKTMTFDVAAAKAAGMMLVQ
jgi:predicted nucleic-acid-binding protein